MNARVFTTLALAALAALPLTAQQDQKKDRLSLGKVPSGEHNGLPGRWTCIVGSQDKGVTMVRLDTITSISKQTYMLEGSQRILEVTIDTTGNNSVRFYCLGGNAASNRILSGTSNARSIVEKHANGTTRFPAKKYPEATHSHNIEFQLATEDDIHKVYESAVHAWVKNTSQTLRVNN